MLSESHNTIPGATEVVSTKNSTLPLPPLESLQQLPTTMPIATTIGPKLAPYNPTNLSAVYIALRLLNIGPADILYDLGCG